MSGAKPATVARGGTETARSPEATERYLDLYRQMLVVRRFEDTVQSLFLKGEVHGTTHLYSGQEAVSVGVCSVLDPGGRGDRVAATYRGHGASLAIGVDPQGLMDELLGRETGVCGGRAGSMNIADLRNGLIGCFGIIGGSIAAATGAALALRGSGAVAVAFFGDGTTNHGYFHECLNFAKVFELPLIFVCENNRYGEFTPFEAVTAGEIRARPAAMGIPAETIDGNDVLVVREAAQKAVDHAAEGGGPVFIEALTYRFVGHSRSDPGKYRPPGELDSWRERDPLRIARDRLAQEHGVAEGELEAVADSVEAQMQEVSDKALAAPFPEPDSPASEFKESAS